MLRLGDKGPEVHKLQELLAKNGGAVTADGTFGPRTDKALRSFQRRHGLVADGIAGPRTLRTLGAPSPGSRLANTVDAVRRLGRPGMALCTAKDPVRSVATKPAHMTLSQAGMQAIYLHETQKGVSNRLHWPKGASGVTLGPGYDMKTRDRATIERAMVAVGLDAATARRIAEASGKTGDDAKKFCTDNRDLVNLTDEQQLILLRQTASQYERIVRAQIKVALLQHEYDALVSFAYNPGGRFATVARLINQGQVVPAMDEIRKAVTSKGEVMQGLVLRRDREVALYLSGDGGH